MDQHTRLTTQKADMSISHPPTYQNSNCSATLCSVFPMSAMNVYAQERVYRTFTPISKTVATRRSHPGWPNGWQQQLIARPSSSTRHSIPLCLANSAQPPSIHSWLFWERRQAISC